MTKSLSRLSFMEAIMAKFARFVSYTVIGFLVALIGVTAQAQEFNTNATFEAPGSALIFSRKIDTTATDAAVVGFGGMTTIIGVSQLMSAEKVTSQFVMNPMNSGITREAALEMVKRGGW